MAGAGALLLYEHYAGENPILDTVYDLRLRRLDLDALDRFCVTNRRRSDVIVSLTTLPSRVDRLPLTLKSLLAQRMSPSAIRLHVPPVSRREGRPYEIPAHLRRLRSVTIVPADDYGPATKVIPALLDLPGDRRILVVDDDRIYHRRFVPAWLSRRAAGMLRGI